MLFQNLILNILIFVLFIGTGDIVAVMITESKVKEILNYLEKNISVLMAIAVGSRVPLKNFSRGSLVFVSISFIVLMIISSAWLIFYFIQKIRYTSARDRNQVRALCFFLSVFWRLYCSIQYSVENSFLGKDIRNGE